MNVCSYHLQEAGATPVQEIAYSLATAIGVLDAVRDSGQVSPEQFSQVFGSISFFVNAGIRFVEEICKLRAMTDMWERIGRERYGVTDDKALRFRYGVQVNSLGLTEAQPENNVQRIVLEMLAVTLSKRARARSVQLPAWNEALGLPRPWDQQWSLRMQQVLAFETDLLEYDDIFDGSTVIEGRTAELRAAAQAELDDVLAMGGAFEAIETLKSGSSRRWRRARAGSSPASRSWSASTTSSRPPSRRSAATARSSRSTRRSSAELVADVAEWRAARDQAAVDAALDELRRAAESRRQRDAAVDRPGEGRRHHRRVGRRDAFGVRRVPRADRRERRHRLAPRGWARSSSSSSRWPAGRRSSSWRSRASTATPTAPSRSPWPRATRAWRSSTPGIRSTPEQIAASARDEDPDVIGLSILSGSHLDLVPDVLDRLEAMGVDAPVVVGGIIPEDDRPRLAAMGVAAVYTPKDFQLAKIMRDVADLAVAHRAP